MQTYNRDTDTFEDIDKPLTLRQRACLLLVGMVCSYLLIAGVWWTATALFDWFTK